MLDLLTIGNISVDLNAVLEDATVHCDSHKKNCELCVSFGKKIPIHTSTQSVGGNAANVAIGAQRIGLKVGLWSAVGDDLYADIIRADLKKNHISTALLYTQAKTTTKHGIVINHHAERTILSYQPIYKYPQIEIPKTKWIYYTSLGSGFSKVQSQILSYLKKNPHTKLATNPGSYQLAHGIHTFKKILPYTTILFINHEEAQLLIQDTSDIATCLKKLHTYGVHTIVITDGQSGAYSFDGTEMLHMPIYPIKPIARTGAGDAFASGFLSAIIKKQPIAHALAWGSANAGGVIQKFGAHNGLFTQSEIIKLIKKYKKIIPKHFS